MRRFKEDSVVDTQSDLNNKDLEADIKRRILLDIKSAGRRLGTDQMMIRYGSEGAAAEKVIRELGEKGILIQGSTASGTAGQSGAVRAAGPSASAETSNTASSAGRNKELSEEIEEAIVEVSRAVRSAVTTVRSEFRNMKAREAMEHERYRPVHNRSPRNKMRHRTDYYPQEQDPDEKEDASYASPADRIPDYPGYLARVRSEARRSGFGFVGHLLPFAAVNGMLMLLNARVSPGFPWALFPLGGWGIGLVEHFTSVIRKKDKLRELEELPPLDDEQLDLFKKIQKKKDGVWHHTVSNIGTSLFLFMINAITSPMFWWAAIPSIFMGIGVISHIGRYFQKKGELDEMLASTFGLSGPGWRRKLKKSSFRPRTRVSMENNPYAELIEQARNARDAIVRLVGVPEKETKKRTKKEPLSISMDEDLVPILDSYLDQIEFLAKRTVEVDGIIESIPSAELKRDRDALMAKIESHPSDILKNQYLKSLEEIDRQEASFTELKDQRELLELKMRSSVNTIKQMHLDMARLSGMSDQDETLSSRTLREKTSELNKYLEDLKAGYAELERLEEQNF